MDRIEFMEQLERLLKDLPENDRQDALEWYQDYFDEAGPENEAKVIQELGSPGRVAASIMAGMGSQQDRGEYTETGYQDPRSKERLQTPMKQHKNKRKRGAGGWALIIILLVFASPILLGVGGGLIGLVFGILGAVIGVLAAGFAAIITCLAWGIGSIVSGFSQCFVHMGNGLLWIGEGMVSIAAAVLLVILFAWLAGCVFPKVFRVATNFISRVLHRGKAGDTHEETV